MKVLILCTKVADIQDVVESVCLNRKGNKMVIQHNMMAMNASRQNGIVTRHKEKTTEKLSSGYRINRAADDAAGLAISEKMRRQIRGLSQAVENAQDGISLVQVADGALNEMHDIIQRVNELSVQAANGTNTDVDRGYIQQEVGQLRTEINRICKTTTFNEIYLFDTPSIIGIDTDDYSHAVFDESVTLGGTSYSRSKELDFSQLNAGNMDSIAGKAFSVICSAGCGQRFTFSFNNTGTNSASMSGTDLNINVDVSGFTTGAEVAAKVFELAESKQTDILTSIGGSFDSTPTAGTIGIGHANGMALDGDKLIMYALSGGNSGYVEATQMEGGDRTIPLQVGSEAGQIIPLNLYNLSPAVLGMGDINVSTVPGAKKAIDQAKTALGKVSEIRSYYGAMQNRLEHTIKNLNNIVENTTSAESSIRDTDMATTMVDYSNTNILSQAGISMMTQANQMNQTVLSLLQ